MNGNCFENEKKEIHGRIASPSSFVPLKNDHGMVKNK